jgi:DNA topoisomerase-1
MAKNLIIVESPAKARTITKFLSDDYTVVASMGHVRDLPSSELGFDPNNNFTPLYEVTKDKKKTIQEIKKHIAKDTTIFLATDEDREGESISWHLIEALKIQKHPKHRIVFHEITKTAILKALQNPRQVDDALVNAQQARRILDRAVGYELSPLLWTKVKPGLSAGRVQSVALRLIVEREREIRDFQPEEFWRIKADFQEVDFRAELAKYKGKKTEKAIPNETQAREIADSLSQGAFVISEIEEKEAKRAPIPPFTTSTLQQEASLKLGFSVKRTMAVAQQLYEGNFEIPDYSGGLITYMRTDSTSLSADSLAQAREVIVQEYGEVYALKKPRQFKTKSQGAQEAHEAIRPVDLSLKPQDVRPHLSAEQAKLYDLIWKRMVACQMTEAVFAKTTLRITAGKDQECQMEVKGQRLVFPGFLRAYTEGSENPEADLERKDVILPKVEQNQRLTLKPAVITEQHFTKPPARYTEAGLVKKLEGEGIGRPSTYAPTISTIQDRQYVERGDDRRLRPTDLGEVVTNFLVNHFADVVNVGFTKKIEEDLDRVAHQETDWVTMMRDFYWPFHESIEQKKDLPPDKGERVLGTDPQSGRQVSVRVGRYGPMVQIGTKDDEDKPKFASLPKGVGMQEIELEAALKLFDLPRNLGTDEAGEDVIVNRGRYGPYVKLGKDFFSIPTEEDPMSVDLERALEIIREGKAAKAKNTLHDFGEIQVLNGRFGPYIKYNKKNFKIPKGTDPETLDKAACEKIIQEAPPPRPRRKTKAS